MSRRPRLGALLGALLAASCGGDGRTPVVVYSPHGRDLLGAMERAYEAAHPEIDVRWLDMGSQEVYDRVRSERANPQCDVWFGGPDSIFSRGAEEGLLAALRPAWSEWVPEASRGPRDLYFGVYRTLPVLLFNSAAVPEVEAPGDWDDLLDARWQGKVLVRDPIASGTLRTVWGMVLARSVGETGGEERGWNWLRRLDGQTKEYTANSALLFEKLKRREGLVSIWELSDVLLARKQGAPFGFRLASSGTPVINDAIALVAGAPHADAARGYIEWAGSREAQELAAREAFKLPARTDLEPAALPEWSRPVLAALHPAEYDRALAARETPRWMSEWDRAVRGSGAR